MRKRSSNRRPRRSSTSSAVAVGLLAVVLLALAPAGAVAAKARTITPSGSAFVAETGGGHVALRLSRDGRQVTRAFVGYTLNCSDGSSFTDFDRFRSIPISATRTFRASYDSGPVTGTALPGVTFRFTGLLTGRRNARATSVAGTARFTVTTTLASGESLSCDTGTVRYTARD